MKYKAGDIVQTLDKLRILVDALEKRERELSSRGFLNTGIAPWLYIVSMTILIVLLSYFTA